MPLTLIILLMLLFVHGHDIVMMFVSLWLLPFFREIQCLTKNDFKVLSGFSVCFLLESGKICSIKLFCLKFKQLTRQMLMYEKHISLYYTLYFKCAICSSKDI